MATTLATMISAERMTIMVITLMVILMMWLIVIIMIVMSPSRGKHLRQ